MEVGVPDGDGDQDVIEESIAGIGRAPLVQGRRDRPEGRTTFGVLVFVSRGAGQDGQGLAAVFLVDTCDRAVGVATEIIGLSMSS